MAGGRRAGRQSVALVRTRLEDVAELAAKDSGLAVVVTSRLDGSPSASVVNAGVIAHPVTREAVVAFVARGHARKLVHLRAVPLATVVFRTGWEWIAVEGHAELAGPDDALGGVDDLPLLLRTVYASAVGGTAADWAGLDEAMAAEGHTAVLVRPVRVYSNPPGSEH